MMEAVSVDFWLLGTSQTLPLSSSNLSYKLQYLGCRNETCLIWLMAIIIERTKRKFESMQSSYREETG
jgi:hypothetical protein